jgi:hypothetical protein
VPEPRSTWVRRAGRVRLPDGAELLWSMAEGERGRRWRGTTTVDGRITHAVLIEVGTDLRPSRLELTTEAGMLTLHPERDGRSAHGNVVHRGGVRPLALPWSPDHEFEVIGRPIGTLIMLRRMARLVRVGEGETVPVLAIDPGLTVRVGTRVVRRLTEGRWEVADLAAGRSIVQELDGLGLPPLATGAREWPLET